MVLVLAGSCTSRETTPDASRAGTSATDSAEPKITVPWFDGVAPILLVPAHSNDRALVVAADSLATDLEDGSLEPPATLVRLDGSVSTVRVALSSTTEGCVDGVLQPAPSSVWGVGFVGRAPTALRVDSLRGMSQGDSASLTPEIFRLASRIPNAAGGRFAGLPFSLIDLWRARTPDGTVVLIATTKRQINQEDSPLEERTLIVAEGDSSSNLALVFSSRSTGPEETVEGNELLGIVAFPGRTDLQLIVAHNFGEENSYSIIERARRGSWTLRWASRRFSC
jgi:hypothetical protein